ncbi:MAG: metallophosphoesterase [Acholeplasmatales bacterium]|jgi:2',3'-cyclic-nucleotide 2'-phosphodiesterase (5'-nucleotidase family)|nr:metallophosphoesterase [Acholeplasmatales bacterium]
MKRLFIYTLSLFLIFIFIGCEEKNHKITFYTNAEFTTSVVVEVEDRKNVSIPNIDFGNNLVPIDWFLDKELNERYDFNKLVYTSFSLYPKLVSASTTIYTVTFNSNGGTSVGSINVVASSTISAPPSPTKTSYTFLGWYEGDNLFDFSLPINSNITLNARYSSNVSPTSPRTLKIYYINDLHGGLKKESGRLGISYIANYINTLYNEDPENTLVIAGGDMFQGSAISNYFQGLSTLEMLNKMHFDAMILGNHEFDWYIETVTQYFDKDLDNGEANFPLLAANAFYKGTTNIISNMEPYTIVNKNGIKVGIIGTIGYGLENSIAYSRIQNYEFGKPQDYVEYYSKYLRETEKCDIVISASHSGGTDTFYDLNTSSYASENGLISYLPYESRVDAIFNAHTHQAYVTSSNNIPIIQSGAYGSNVGVVSLNVNNKQVVSTSAKNVTSDPLLKLSDKEVEDLYNMYNDLISPIFTPNIITSGASVSKYDLTEWISALIGIYTGATVAAHNPGGTRTTISNNQQINRALVWEIMPFDNVLKTVYLTGRRLKELCNNTDIYYDLDAYYLDSKYNSVDELDDNTLYLFATHDYIFDKEDYHFNEGVNPVYEGTVVRELMINELLLQKDVYPKFLITSKILISNKTARYKTAVTQNIITYYIPKREDLINELF